MISFFDRVLYAGSGTTLLSAVGSYFFPILILACLLSAVLTTVGLAGLVIVEESRPEWRR